MTTFYAAIYRISCIAAFVAAAAIVYVVCHIAVEIVLRGLFQTSTFVLGEFVGYAMSICVIWSLGYTLEHGDHIRVGLLLDRLGERAYGTLTALAAFLASAGSLGLAWMFWIRVDRAFERGTVSPSVAAMPTWIPEAAVMLGFLLFALQLLAHGLRHLTGHPSPAARDEAAPLPVD